MENGTLPRWSALPSIAKVYGLKLDDVLDAYRSASASAA